MKTERTNEEEPTNEQLELVARHGSGKFTKAIAVVKLMRRQGRMDELREKIDDTGGG